MKKSIVALILCLFAFTASVATAANPVADLIDRIDPGASGKFILKLKPGTDDFFELDSKGGKVVIIANNYVSMATGLNWYLKHHAGIHLSWNGMTASLPATLPLPKKERHATNLKYRYDFNYCTYSYTMPFWDWQRWEQEIDWMALHGVNLPLAAVGMECVYRNMMLKLGYSPAEVNEFIAGPAFIAWWAMNNLEGWGGPNPDSWYQRQEQLQKRILARMKEFGIKPVFPGYCGMMPHDADEKLGLNLTKAGKPWNGFTRPAFLQPTDERYAEIAKLYYDEQKALFGTADFYSMDPFHELKNADNVDFDAAGKAVMGAMKSVNPKAVWVVQGWTENPREQMIANLKQGDLLILDLFAECRPMWGAPSIWRREQGYGHHDWVFCLLENFGGNVGLHGRLDQLLENFYLTRTSPLAKNIKGIGFSMEGSENNPFMFELMSELPWRQEPITKELWVKEYVKARYGADDPDLIKAWSILASSIYNCPRGNNQQGPHESIFCARPNLDNFQASSWSKMQNYYDGADTEAAARLFVKAADKHRGNNNFEYDLVDVVRQAISDRARKTYQHTVADYKCFNRKGFSKNSAQFLRLLTLQDSLLATRSEFKVGRWLDFAKRAGATPEEKKLYEWNARVQITTWGPRYAANTGKLRDYAHKEWSGLLNDFYQNRWKAFFAMLATELNGGPKAQVDSIDYYAIEEPWTLRQNPYTPLPEGSSVDVAKSVFAEIFGADPPTDYAAYVDTRVGTAASITKTAGVFGKKTEEYGQTIPAVLEPFGMNFWTAQTSDTEHKCVAPYYYADTLLQGFRNSHWIVGGCTQDYGSMTLMPLSGTLRTQPEQRATPFSHASETARPDYYAVTLPAEGIDAEMTATSRAAIFKFTYSTPGKAYLVVNPNSDEGCGFIAYDSVANLIYGYNPVHRIYQGKGQPAGFAGFFVVQPDRRPVAFGTYSASGVHYGLAQAKDAPEIGCFLEFDLAAGDCLMAKAAASFTSGEGAKANLQAEIPHWDFAAVRSRLSDIWQAHLGQIAVDADPQSMRKFYGALYRTSFLPHRTDDADGAFCEFASGKVSHLPEGCLGYFDDFSLWDTYRAQHPLQVLLRPTLSGAMMQSLVDKYKQGGWLPIFPCWNSYTAAMIGDHAIAAIADACVKGIDNFDLATAYEAMRHNAFDYPTTQEYADGKGRRALQSYLHYGYVPLEDSVPHAYHKQEQVSRTMEYAFDDFALAQVAKKLGRKADYDRLMERSLNYRNVINPSTGYACGRYANGNFAADSPFEFTKHITEGAPCHYTWYVPHDPEGLMKMMGGKQKYVAKLDSMFSEGRYWHGNEPCHQVAFMYGFADEPQKMAREVRHIMDTEYLAAPGGLSGNDDAGQMSAWYVFAALGFYPVCPASPYYVVSGPTFTSAMITLENGKLLWLSAPRACEEGFYPTKILHNGKPYPHKHLHHADLMEGGLWQFL